MPSAPGLKREASEVSLSGIPLADSQSFDGSRNGVVRSKQLARREVDLGSFASNMSSKAKTKANVEAELKEAIAALKKPNRELAGKAIVETAERRSASASHPRSKSFESLRLRAILNFI